MTSDMDVTQGIVLKTTKIDELTLIHDNKKYMFYIDLLKSVLVVQNNLLVILILIDVRVRVINFYLLVAILLAFNDW